LDLPYYFLADGQQQEMTLDQDFDFGPYLAILQSGLEGLKKFRENNKDRRKQRRNRWKKSLGF